MEVIIVPILIVLVIVLALAMLSGDGAKPIDSREPYLRDQRGRIYAIAIGPGANHEDFLHDGTPHQNPAMREQTRWCFIFPYTVEVSYYPITINGRLQPDLEAIEAQVSAAQVRGHDVSLVTLDAGLEREVIRRENGEQLANGVTTGALAYKLNGKRR